MKRFMFKVARFVAFTAAWVLSGSVLAAVNLGKGSYCTNFTDFSYAGDIELKLDRAYDSKADHKGIFGWGWRSIYEHSLKIEADGSVTLHEYGRGAAIVFKPTGADRMRLVSNHQVLVKTRSGYARTLNGGKTESYDGHGRLTLIRDRSGNFVRIAYERDKRTTTISDNLGRKMTLRFNARGMVQAIDATDGKRRSRALYEYNEQDELTRSQGPDGQVLTFKYDGEGRHHLVEVRHADGTAEAISYFGRDEHDDVRSVKERGGKVTEYRYERESVADGRRYKVDVAARESDEASASVSSHEYFYKRQASGAESLQRVVKVHDGERTDSTYNGCICRPLSIERKDGQTTFEYDAQGLLARKETPEEIRTLTYHPTLGMVRSVSTRSKADARETQSARFRYDARGDLTRAESSDGSKLSLTYDGRGRIATIKDRVSGQVLAFRYNRIGKPVRIKVPGQGLVVVKYQADGSTISNVESRSGHRAALVVTSMFQKLTQVLRLTKVGLD